MVPEFKQRSYFEIKAQLDAYRLANPVTPELKPPTINVLQEPANSSVVKESSTVIYLFLIYVLNHNSIKKMYPINLWGKKWLIHLHSNYIVLEYHF